MKDILLVVSILVSIALTVVVVRFNEKATKAGKNLEEERYSRMVAEESLQKSAAKLATLEAKLKSADSKMTKIQDILEQEKDVNADLKQQYEKLAETKADLELKVKAALEAQAQAQAVVANAEAEVVAADVSAGQPAAAAQ